MPALLNPELYNYSRALVPADLRTREWNGIGMPWAMDANGVRTKDWVAERGLWMAGETRIDRLMEFRARVGDILGGRLSEEQARDRLRVYLDQTGYEAPEGLRGTIKDLTTSNRLNITLRTNVDQCRGFAQKQRLAGNFDYPAMELARKRHSKEPRDWDEIWAAAGGKEYQGRKIALTSDPVWRAISDFGTDYPPFKFGSGMWAWPVSREDCIELGIIGEEEFPDTGETESLNQSLEKFYPSGVDKGLLDAMNEVMGGFTEVVRDQNGYSLRFTDPNGCRPYEWDRVGDVITDPLPTGYNHYQADAFQKWVEDSRVFGPDGIKAHSPKATLNEKEDLIRLFTRINPVTDEGGENAMHRGLAFKSDSEAAQFLNGIRKNNYEARPGYIAESWTDSPATAEVYAGSSPARVIISCNSYKSRRRVDGIYQSMDMGNKAREGESIVLNGTRFRVTRSRKETGKKGGTTYYVDVEEI